MHIGGPSRNPGNLAEMSDRVMTVQLPKTGLVALPWLQSSSPLTDKKKNVICIQWFVLIATSYLVLFRSGQVVREPLAYLLLLAPLGGMLVLQRLPQSAFDHRFFPQTFAVLDTILISIAIAFNRESPWDLLLIFFFGIFIAAIGESLTQIVIGCLVLSIISVVIVPLSSNGAFQFDSDTLLRIPLIFGASVVYGYLADQVKTERRKTVQLEQSGQQQLLMKDQFLSHVSHELRSPLTAIYQFVTILIDGLAGDLNPEQRDYLTIVLRNVKQLQTMISELLEVTRAETGKLAIDPRCVSLADLIDETFDALLTTAATKTIMLSADVPADLPSAYADPQRLKQILINLIDNAIKFTPAKGTITVSARPFDQDPNFLCVAVADTGCGISPEGTQRIFDRLYQEARTIDSGRKGLGLGLYICKELVSLHRGRIWVESVLGKGSVFYFTLPIFSLAKLLYPVITENNRLKSMVALISIKLHPVNEASQTKITETMRREAWNVLQRCILPDKTLLLPRMVGTEESEVFYAVSSDQNATEVAARNIQEQLGECNELQDPNIGVTVLTTKVEIPSTQDNSSLEQLVDDVSSRIADLMKTAIPKKVKDRKSDFLGVMSREVRTPLSVVMGYAGILRDKLLGELNSEQENALRKIMDQAIDLTAMINNVAEAQRIETGLVEVKSYEVRVASLLEELKSTYEPAWTKALAITWDYASELPVTITDGNKLRAILQNLMNNAVKFTEKGGVTLSARHFPETESLEFKVADTGIGIPRENIPAIFEKFRQLQPSEINPLGGMGLGLYIVKTFTELLGGKVDVESELGKGSVFKVTMPVHTTMT